jgi:hypothetical protein
MEVRLRSKASRASAIVRVSDVADVLGEDPHLAAALADVTLFPAPSPGTERTLTQNELRGLLGLSGVERGDVVITGSEAVTIAGQTTAASHAHGKRPLAVSGVKQALFETPVAHPKPPAARPANLPEPKPAEPRPLVERGTTVTVSAKAAGVRITTSGRALQAGALGDSIQVELTDNKQRVLAAITGPEAVEVAAATVAAAGR